MVGDVVVLLVAAAGELVKVVAGVLLWIISVGISTDKKDSTKRNIEIDQASFGLDRSYLSKGFEEKEVKAYLRYMVDMAVHLGADRSRAEEEMNEVLKFEKQLASYALAREERRNETALHHPMALGSVSDLYNLSWVDYANSIIRAPSLTIDGNEIVNVAVPKYVRQVGEYLADVPARVQANYLIWRNVMYVASYLDEAVSGIKIRYDKALTGKAQKSPRWEECAKEVAGLDRSKFFYFLEGSLTNAVGSMYVRRHFPPKAKAVVEDVTDQVVKEFRLILEETSWMDDGTKERAFEKAERMANNIAYPGELLDDGLLNEFYSGLSFEETGFMQNILRLNKFVQQYYANGLRVPVDKTSWKTHGGAAIVNAFYSAEENSINFPAGILSGVFFDAERPAYLNYGAYGIVVGHEITHGYDDQGSQRDAYGKK